MAAVQSHIPVTDHPSDSPARASIRSVTPPEIYIQSEADDAEDGASMRMVSMDFGDEPVSIPLRVEHAAKDHETQKAGLTTADPTLPRLVTGSPLDLMTGLGLHLRSCTLEQDVSYNEWNTVSRESSAVEQSKKAQMPRYRKGSSSSEDSYDSQDVNWSALERTEESQPRDGHADESEALLLARLEQQNDALATDPRFGHSSKTAKLTRTRTKKQGRPPSLQMLKQLIDDSAAYTFEQAPPSTPPPMTELEFWTALVQDHNRVIHKLPSLTMNKIKAGVPPPLRGVVWVSMVGARDEDLAKDFDRLVLEPSPYETLIGKDVGRSFPGVEMFKDPKGQGQRMLGRVLKCFSLYDKEIGYCQGLGFLVGPLLMHMGDRDAFCVLVKLMENYGLRSCFLPNLAGLHLRIYQFQRYLAQEMPTLAAHLASLQVEAAYLSQWFLSFFAVTCPLNMLFRIYDVIFAEGASETIMRVALALMKRNEQQIMESEEFEQIMHLLLSRALWSPYEDHADVRDPADELVNDFMDMTGIVNRESMQNFEAAFKELQSDDPTTWSTVMPAETTTAASRFLGRSWFSKGGSTASLTPLQTHSRVGSMLKRSPSKQSVSTLNSADASVFDSSSSTTNASHDTSLSRDSDSTSLMMKGLGSMPTAGGMMREDNHLHQQIEDLLMAMSDLQRQQALLMTQLQREREERMDDQRAFESLLKHLCLPTSPAVGDLSTKEERRQTLPHSLAPITASITPITQPTDPTFSTALASATARVAQYQASLNRPPESPSSGQYETKQRLRDSLMRSRTLLSTEASRSAALGRQLDKAEHETLQVREDLREMQIRLQEVIVERNRLESRLNEPQRPKASRADSMAWSEVSTPVETSRPAFWRSDTMESTASSTRSNSVSSIASNTTTTSTKGLRELKLSASVTPRSSTPTNIPPRRIASLATQRILSTPDHAPAREEEMLVELVNAKTAEALARQELEESKAELEKLRKLLNMTPTLGAGFPPSALALPRSVLDKQNGVAHKPTPSDGTLAAMMPPAVGGLTPQASPARPTSPARTPTQASVNQGAGGWGWGWGRRTASVSVEKDKA